MLASGVWPTDLHDCPTFIVRENYGLEFHKIGACTNSGYTRPSLPSQGMRQRVGLLQCIVSQLLANYVRVSYSFSQTTSPGGSCYLTYYSNQWTDGRLIFVWPIGRAIIRTCMLTHTYTRLCIPSKYKYIPARTCHQNMHCKLSICTTEVVKLTCISLCFMHVIIYVPSCI